jgi:hypothetical protein
MRRIPNALKCFAFCAILYTSLLGTAKASILAMDVSPTCLCPGTAHGTFGWEFTVTGPGLNVTALGLWQYDFTHLHTSHEVVIWDYPTEVELAEATIPASGATQVGSASPLGSWQMVALSNPVYLAPGTYAIGAFYPPSPSDSADYGSGPSNGLTEGLSSYVQYVRSLDTNPPDEGDPTIKFPTFSENGPFGAFGPNFEFVTPEPSSFTLLFAAGFALAGLKRMKR